MALPPTGDLFRSINQQSIRILGHLVNTYYVVDKVVGTGPGRPHGCWLSGWEPASQQGGPLGQDSGGGTTVPFLPPLLKSVKHDRPHRGAVYAEVISVNTSTTHSFASALSHVHASFQAVLPRIEHQARVHFSDVRCPHRRDDAIAETLALVWR